MQLDPPWRRGVCSSSLHGVEAGGRDAGGRGRGRSVGRVGVSACVVSAIRSSWKGNGQSRKSAATLLSGLPLLRYRALMFHHVAKARAGHLLFEDAVEGYALWRRITTSVPGPVALCLMPNHVHLVHSAVVKRELGWALSGHTRWLHGRRGGAASLLDRSPDPVAIVGSRKLDRQVRYVHLNPCRARLVDDPLAWPFSTHLDAVGLALFPVRRSAPDPHRFHHYVSADPSADVAGTRLPSQPSHPVPVDKVLRATAFATRMPVRMVVGRRGPARTHFVRVAKALTDASAAEIAAAAGLSRSSVAHAPPQRCPIIASLAADPRLDGWERRVRTLARHGPPGSPRTAVSV